MNSVSRVTALSICFWNVNGVKNKFLATELKSLFENKDILIVSETHFNVRTKCPDNFILIARSRAVESKKVGVGWRYTKAVLPLSI